jgi:PAS domain S-box-containing protein
MLKTTSLIRRPLSRLLGALACWRARGRGDRRAGPGRLGGEFARFGPAFERAALGLSLVTLDGTVLSVNEQLCTIAGYSREELLEPGKFLAITHPDDLESDIARRRTMLAGELERFSIAKRYVRKDGDVVWVSYTGSLLCDEHGRPEHYLGIIEDITDRKRIETALRESEERLRLAVEAAGMGVRELDMTTGQAWSTPEAEKIFGRDEERDKTFEGWFANVHPEDQPNIRSSWERARAAPGNDLMHEYRFRRPDGEWRWISANARLEFRDGRPVRTVGVIQDITERKQIEIALRESEARLRISQEAGGIGGWDRDYVSDRLHWSDLQCRQFGVDPADGGSVTTQTWRDAVHPDDFPVVERNLRAVMANGDTDFEIEYRINTPAGVRWMNGRGHIIRDAAGKVVRMMGVDMDVTERRALEDELRGLTETLEARVREEIAARETAQTRAAQAERMQALGQLAGGIAHDFNNVLQAVMGALRLIERRPADQESVQRLARLANGAVGRGTSITRRLLTLGQRGELTAERLDIAELLRELGEILTHTLGATIAVRLRLATGLRPVLADRGQLETVLVNLATNARDAMPHGGDLFLSAEPETVAPPETVSGPHPAALPAGRYIRLTVADLGEGMDAATLARAREPFFTTKRSGSGTGLGLAMAQAFAEQSGGALAIESKRGTGTTVTLWLPEAAPDPADDAVALRAAPEPRTHARILLVDDEALIREVLTQQLTDAGFDVLVAANGAEALALAETESVDAVVTDLAMAGVDGLAVIRGVQARSPGLPAVLLTGYAGDETALALSGAMSGTFSLLRKPVSDVQLVDRLSALLAARPVVRR